MDNKGLKQGFFEKIFSKNVTYDNRRFDLHENF